MKLIKKLFVAILVLSTVFSFYACKSKDKGTTIIGDSSYTGEKTEIEIWLWEAGYGKDYLIKIAESFAKKYPQYTIKLETTADSGFMENKLPLNAELNTADLLMSVKSGSIPTYAEPLTDVLNYVNPGETKTIAEKLGITADDIRYSGDKYYYTPYASGWTSLTYNEDILKDYFVPKTTDQLVELTNELVADKIVPFIHFIGGGYWDACIEIWQSQYIGATTLHEIYENPTLEKITDDNNGYYEALKVVEQCLNSSKKYYSGSNAMNFTDAQTLYIEGCAAMMVNGTWMEYEMRNNYEPGTKNFSMMKMPVLSSIITKCPSILDEDELQCVIDAVDSGKSALSGTGYEVTQADYDRISAARLTQYNFAIGHSAVIPKYSDNIEGAKKFLQYYYSDEALKIYTETTCSKNIADFDGNVTIDQSNWSSFQKQQYKMSEECIPFAEASNKISPIFTVGGCTMNGGISVITKLSTNNESDRLSAQELWRNIKTYQNNNWARYLANCGLSE